MHTPFLLFSWPTLAHTFHFSSLLHFRAPSTPPSSHRPPPLRLYVFAGQPGPDGDGGGNSFSLLASFFSDSSLSSAEIAADDGGCGKASTFLAYLELYFHFNVCFLMFSSSFGSFDSASLITVDFRPFSGDGELRRVMENQK